MYGHTPLLQASKQIAHQLSGPIASLFQTFAEQLEKGSASAGTAWEDSLEKVWPKPLLKKKKYEILRQYLRLLPFRVCSPLHYINRRISSSPDKNPRLFTIFSFFAWARFASASPETALKKKEYEILRQFGETLGRHDLISQQKHIKLALTHLETEEAEANLAQAKNEKMVKSLGFLSGLLLILLLM